jgi:hypothetical protein
VVSSACLSKWREAVLCSPFESLGVVSLSEYKEEGDNDLSLGITLGNDLGCKLQIKLLFSWNNIAVYGS